MYLNLSQKLHFERTHQTGMQLLCEIQLSGAKFKQLIENKCYTTIIWNTNTHLACTELYINSPILCSEGLASYSSLYC